MGGGGRCFLLNTANGEIWQGEAVVEVNMRDGNGILVGAMGNDAMRYATWALTWE